MPQSNTHDALIILKNVFRAASRCFAVPRWSVIISAQTSVFELACHESPFPDTHPPSFRGLQRPPPPRAKPFSSTRMTQTTKSGANIASVRVSLRGKILWFLRGNGCRFTVLRHNTPWHASSGVVVSKGNQRSRTHETTSGSVSAVLRPSALLSMVFGFRSRRTGV